MKQQSGGVECMIIFYVTLTSLSAATVLPDLPRAGILGIPRSLVIYALRLDGVTSSYSVTGDLPVGLMLSVL
jgi:hypothetical protein